MTTSGHSQRFPPKKNSPLAPIDRTRIDKERARLFEELMRLRQMQGTSTPVLETARVLLTRQWIKSDWRERARLIKAADWMLGVELRGTIRRQSSPRAHIPE
jgi:hypothetical protein